MKKEPVRVESDIASKKDRGNLVGVTRKNLLENLRKSSIRKHHDRVERTSVGTKLWATRGNFRENCEIMVRVSPSNDFATIGDHQEKLIASGIMEKVRMLEENQNHEPDSIPFEDISMFLYRETAPEFKERVRDLEKKLLHSVSDAAE